MEEEEEEEEEQEEEEEEGDSLFWREDGTYVHATGTLNECVSTASSKLFVPSDGN